MGPSESRGCRGVGRGWAQAHARNPFAAHSWPIFDRAAVLTNCDWKKRRMRPRKRRAKLPGEKTLMNAADRVGGDARSVAARIERLPFTSWHFAVGLIVASAWFFDAVDALAIAYVLPVLNGLWDLSASQTGMLIAGGYAGQTIGSIAAGSLAERWGRAPVLIMTLLVFSVMSLACAFAWNFESMLTFRFIQGIGLGGEVPIMITYINEFSKAAGRGRFALGIQVLFAVGLVGSALLGVWVVPTLGWQWMFYIGALPALLALPLRWIVPESPRWLASKGRFEEADRILRHIEAIAVRNGRTLLPLPPDLPVAQPARCRFGDLFRGIYLKRTLTVWCLWICCWAFLRDRHLAAVALPVHLPPAATAITELRLHPDGSDAGWDAHHRLHDRPLWPQADVRGGARRHGPASPLLSPHRCVERRERARARLHHLFLPLDPGVGARHVHGRNLSQQHARLGKRCFRGVAARCR